MKNRDLLLDELYLRMTDYYRGDPARIQHFVKVHSFARLIGHREGLGEEELLILEASALVHDIGIKPAEAIYGNCDGKRQEELGPQAAREMLAQCGFSPEQTGRIAWLVGHHHTYTDIDGMDYRILVEADFLVNLYEDGSTTEAVAAAYKNIFRTESGKKICRDMFGVEGEITE